MNKKRNLEWVKENLSPKADINQIINFETIKGDYRLNSELISKILKGNCFKQQENEYCPLIEGNKVELVKSEGRILWKTYNSKNEYAILTPMKIWELFNEDRYTYSNSQLFDAFNIISEEEMWIRAKREKYVCLRVMLQNEEYMSKYPKTMKYMRRNRGIFTALLNEGEKNVRGKEACHNDEDVFFSASNYLSDITGVNQAEITRFLNGLTLIGLMKKLSFDEIPYALLDNKKYYDFKRINYMAIEPITEEKMIQAESLFIELKKNGIQISNFTKNDIINKFGEIDAERVFPLNCGVIESCNDKNQRRYNSEIRSFLKNIKLIGEDTISKIITLNEEAFFDVIRCEPEKFITELGINKREYKIILKWFQDNSWIIDTLNFFMGVGLKHREVLIVINSLREKSIETFKENPYGEFAEILPFKSLDKAAQAIGYGHRSPERIESIVARVLREANENNHVFCIKKSTVLSKVFEYLKKNSEDGEYEMKITSKEDKVRVEYTISSLKERKMIHLVNLENEEYCYLPLFYEMERELMDSIESRLEMVHSVENIMYLEIEDMSLTREQKTAIENVLANRLSIITGGPGTGKTRTIKGLIDAIKKQNPNASIKVVAPTGVAAKRVADLTGHEASTIHMMLGIKEEKLQSTNKIEADYLIVDESSMVSHTLAHLLFRALSDETSVILVGDVNQLKPVNGDSFFEALCSNSENLGTMIKKIELQKNHRQKKNSLIEENAKRINEGITDLTYDESGEFQFVDAVGSKNVVKSIVEMIEKKMDEGASLSEIQVLSPMNSGEIGVKKLNTAIQGHFNGGSKVFKGKNGIFRVRDRVMQNRNDYRIGIMNGEIGVVKEVHIDYIIVRFSDSDIRYDKDKVTDIELAYAVSIHKSQGLEFPVVIIPLCKQHKKMLNRQLIYTAITRGKENVILVGDTESIISGIKKIDKSQDNNITVKRIARELNYAEAV